MEKWLLSYLIAVILCLIFGQKIQEEIIQTNYKVVLKNIIITNYKTVKVNGTKTYYRPVQEKIVNTDYGPVQGKTYKYSGAYITEYLGIPFAQPPVGNLRFKPPRPLKKPAWNGVFNATTLANSCSAEVYTTGFSGYDFWNPTNTISEDCLQLNMWVPRQPNGGVIVFIYGGAFYSGSSSLDVYNGSVLAAKTNTIVVNLNYRLGILGFGYLEDSLDIPGNMGLLDQQIGLKWVYENIGNFGGDNKKITIWGESAGSVSVTSHLYAPDSFRYFKRVLSNSGIIDSIWGKFSNEYVSNMTKLVAEKLGCKGKKNKLVNCLIKANISDIITVSSSVQASCPLVFGFIFSPIENDKLFFKGNVTKKIEEHDMKKDVDLFIGTTSHEFTYFLPLYFSDKVSYNCGYSILHPASSDENACLIKQEGYDNIFKLISSQLGLPDKIKDKLKKMYDRKGRELRDSVSMFLSEVFFDCDIITYIDKLAPIINGNIYYYMFKATSSSNPWPKWMGAMHGYELEFEFGMPHRKPEMYDKKDWQVEEKFSIYFMKLIGDFVNKGVPSENWKKFNTTEHTGALLNYQKSYEKIKNIKKTFSKTCKVLAPFIPRRMA